MQKQYVYILSNTERSDLVKIGETTKSPRVRAEALSRQTGVIGKWIVEWYMVVPNCKFGETILKNLFEGEHFEKETFKIQLKVAINQSILELIRVLKIDKPEIFIRDKNIIITFLKENISILEGLEILFQMKLDEKNGLISRLESFEIETKKLVKTRTIAFERKVSVFKLLLEDKIEEENGILTDISEVKSKIKILKSLEIDS